MHFRLDYYDRIEDDQRRKNDPRTPMHLDNSFGERLGRQFVKNVVMVDSKPKGRVFIDSPNFKETQPKWHDVQDAKRASIGSHAPSSNGCVVNNMTTSSILFIEETELKQLCNHLSEGL
jgi:hypothetical protein